MTDDFWSDRFTSARWRRDFSPPPKAGPGQRDVRRLAYELYDSGAFRDRVRKGAPSVPSLHGPEPEPAS